MKRYKRKPTKSRIYVVTWFNHFRAVFHDAANTDDRDYEHHVINDTAGDFNFDALNGDTTEADVRQALNSLKKGRPAGPDGITNDLLKIDGDNIIHCLVELFNEILKSDSYYSE